jgi:group I intron endonuclease
MKVFYHRSDLDLDQKMVIYQLKNLVDGKVYIGQTTKRLRDRFVRYLDRSNPFLKRAVLKHGANNFELSVLQRCRTVERLNIREQYWIRRFKSDDALFGYNLQPGGDNKRMHESTRKILSFACSGWYHTPEAKARIAAAGIGKQSALGHHHTEDAKRRIGEASRGNKHSRGRKHSPESRQKMSEAQKGRIITWGDKIAESKTKVRKDAVLAYLRDHPRASLNDLKRCFGVVSNTPFRKLGGLRRLRKEMGVS